ncbi:MAG: entericidin A/B family lipoprotein [Planctomycetes bacterium]|nr:entericidin A/B family lipoprotein [Planctomycetota bacterium]
MKYIAWMLMTGLMLSGLSACNTVEGAGRDLEQLGKHTSSTAREYNNYTPGEQPNGNPYQK